MDEWEALRARLAAAGVDGAEDLGRFVNKPELLSESRFDERAAMPVLIQALPSLTDEKLIGAVAGHLRQPWARPHAFAALLEAFEAAAPNDGSTAAWHLGDAVGTTATAEHVEVLLRISRDSDYGAARQMVVQALGRFKKAPGVAEALLVLIDDPDVALHAMGALRRVVGAREALPHLERVARERCGTVVGEQAARQVKRARTSLSSKVHTVTP